jgi:hypothetical protein
MQYRVRSGFLNCGEYLAFYANPSGRVVLFRD